jgi:hypothetical protein
MSNRNIATIRQFAGKFGLSAILLATSALFFLGDHLMRLAESRRSVRTAIPPITLLGLTVFFYLIKNLRRYWEVAFAFFCGTFGLYLAWSPLAWPEGFLGANLYTAKGITIYKSSEILAVSLPIILLTWLVQRKLAPIYLQKGNLKIGLGVGLGLSLLIFGVYLLSSWSKIDFEKARLVLIWMMIFAFMDAFFEELLLRGTASSRIIVAEVYRVIGEHLGARLIQPGIWTLRPGSRIRDRTNPLWRADPGAASRSPLQFPHAEIGFHLGFAMHTCDNRFDLFDRHICIYITIR